MALPDSPNTIYAPADPVLSVDLNDLQDCIVAAAHGAVQEIVSARALTQAVAIADSGAVPRGPLRFWHVDGLDLGDIDGPGAEGDFLSEGLPSVDDDL